MYKIFSKINFEQNITINIGEKKDFVFTDCIDFNNNYVLNVVGEVGIDAAIADEDAIVELCEEACSSIVVTKNANDFGVHNTNKSKNLLRIPAFAFLYLLGNAEKHGYRGIE